MSWSTTSLEEAAESIFTGEGDHHQAGYPSHGLDGAGDTNADGYAVLLIGAPHLTSQVEGPGQAYLVLGPTASGTRSLGDADAVLTGEVDDDMAGRTVAGVGDTNADGYDDILVVGYYALHGDTRVYLFGGPRGGALDLAGADAIFDSFESGRSAGQEIASAHFIGEHEEAWAGSAVGSMGDLQGDGYGDFFVGAERDDEGGEYAGAVYILYGMGV